MIVVDKTIKEHVGIQKKNSGYLFLHWKHNHLYLLGSGLVGADKDFVLIAPTSFVEWGE